MNFTATEIKTAEHLADSALLDAMIQHPRIRMLVNPDSLTGYGWTLSNTGGSCCALIQDLNNGYQIWATDNGDSIPNEGESVNIGIFSENGSQLAWVNGEDLEIFGSQSMLPKLIDVYHSWLRANLISEYEPMEEILQWPELTPQQRKELEAIQLLHEVALNEY